MSIMITGGTGFLGSYLARHLVQEKGENGIVLYDMYPNLSRVEEIRDQVDIVQGDVLETHELLSTMKKYNVDKVVHLAFIMGGASRTSPVPDEKVLQYLRVQCMGAANVFETSRIHGVSRLVYASSVAIHGYRSDPHDVQEIDEDVLPRPDNFYGACKLWYEHIAAVYHEQHGLDTIGLRPTMTFGLGAGQRGSYASRLMAIPENPSYVVMPELAALGEPIEMPPSDLVTDWMYAADAAEAWYLALTVQNPKYRVFNMRTEQVRLGDVTECLRRILPDVQISVREEPVSLFPLMANDRLRDDLGFRPRYTLESGIIDYVNRVRGQAGLPLVEPS